MAKTEKVHFILEQVRLCLIRKDFMRAQILIRKVRSYCVSSTCSRIRMRRTVCLLRTIH